MKQIIEGGQKRLAVTIGGLGKSVALTRILAIKGSPGWLVDPSGQAAEWRFEGITQQGEETLLYGPPCDERAADGDEALALDAVVSRSFPEALPYMARLVDALLALKARDIPLFPLQSDAILFTGGDGILFLPPLLMREIRDLSPFETNRDSFEAINHPDLKGDAQASFTISALVYRLFTGAHIVAGSSAEELHEQARKLSILPPDRLVPELEVGASALVMAGLGRTAGRSVGLTDFQRAMSEWKARPPFRQISAEEREKLLAATAAEGLEAQKRFRRRMFWEKNWKLIAGVSAIVIAVGIGAGSFISHLLEPRSTKGFSPQAVVETFYKGMNALDNVAMEACVVDKAGRGEISETTNLFVISRVRTGYEGKSNIVPADQWDIEGRKKIDPDMTLYGVARLSVRQEQGEPSPEFSVSYEKWMPASGSGEGPSDSENLPHPHGEQVIDRVLLRQDRGDWVICRIDRISATPLPAPWQ